ncbi:ferrochelatase [Natronospirillum operosum]|uniref:Ferrochelatase n=1 Tax=Natronospirillum operosum TaxID=2759953 RepID=A0A4Z0WAP2_9GAMM|nr:ferrochelatase [Natronospirillum operosum]TGG95212.1 ferrochelatase [Natronospirillum operosum]
MFKGVDDFRHDQPVRTGILLTNLGTPDAPTPSALRRYLKQFLWDPRVVEVPRPLWWLILHGVILNIRPRRSARAYRTVWTERGSPLLYHTQDQCEAIRAYMHARYGEDVVVEFAMRYGNPSIPSALQKLEDQGVRQLLVLPLYPQYSGATTASTFDAIAQDFMQRRWLPELRLINHYHDFAPYIDAMAKHIERHWAEHGRADRILFSYHGVPKKYLLRGDPYHCECFKTSRLLAERLGLNKDEYMTTFQSRFGREEWLKPYTDHTLMALPAAGVKSVQMFCPGFAADCLETIEEIGEENRDYFMEAGGEDYQYIPCLNAEQDHVFALGALLEQHLKGWEPLAELDRSATRAQAERLGAEV